MFYGLATSIISGLLYALSFPPFDLWFLVFPSLFFFYKILLEGRTPFLSGFIFGIIAYGIVLFGIKSIGYEAWIPLTIFMGLMYGALGKVLKYIGNKVNNNIFILIAILSTFDLLRIHFPFGGFPWGYPSTVLISGVTKNFFRTFGPIGFSLVIESLVLLAVLIAIDKGLRKKMNLSYLKYYIVSFIILGVLSLFSINNEDYDFQKTSVGEIEISIVQGNSPCPGARNQCLNERQIIYESHLNLTKSIDTSPLFNESANTRLIVWAESSTGFKNDPLINIETLEQISIEAKRLNATFLIGGDRPIDSDYFQNYGLFIDKNGDILGQYLKQHPVPFVEYIPFRKYLDWIPPLALVPRDMIRGEGQKILTIGRNESWSGIKVSPVISFEGSFDRYIRKSVKEGSELIVILTNQASYGESGMSDQFILMSRANAVSNHRDIVHAAITGKSAFISAEDGEVYFSSDLFKEDIITVLLNGYTAETLYTQFGNYLNYLTILLGSILFLYFRLVDVDRKAHSSSSL